MCVGTGRPAIQINVLLSTSLRKMQRVTYIRKVLSNFGRVVPTITKHVCVMARQGSNPDVNRATKLGNRKSDKVAVSALQGYNGSRFPAVGAGKVRETH